MTVFETGAFQLRSLYLGNDAAAVAADAVKRKIGENFETPVAAIVLGSGLGSLADSIENPQRVAFADIPGFPAATVSGHAGQLILGKLAGRPVVALAGRLHVYEGHDAALAAFPVRVLHALGASVYVASNAAGGIRRTFEPGTLMVIADHINLMFRNPLTGAAEKGDSRFPDMSNSYDPNLRALMHDAAATLGLELEDGVYAALTGPAYETPAEVRMLERFGADAVGMSTVPEVIVARALGMRAVAVSCITNKAAGVSSEPLNHAEVLDIGKQVASQFVALITEFIRKL